MTSKRDFNLLWKRARRDKNRLGLAKLQRLCASGDARERLYGLFKMRFQTNGVPPKSYFRLASHLAHDRDSNCRWQSLILIEDFIVSQPEKVWKIITKHGTSPNADTRTAVGTILIETLFENHFRRYWPRVKALALKSRLFRHTLSMVWPPKQTKKEVDAFWKTLNKRAG